MPDPRPIDRLTARRFLVARHLLAPPRGLPAAPGSVRTVLERLGSLQFDPLDVTGRNHDLVLAARIDGYRRAWTDALLYEERWLYEAYNKGLSLLPTSELPWYRVGWDRERDGHENVAFVDHQELVAELLARIRREGPLSATDVEPRAAIDWYWRPTNQVRAILEALAEAGVLGLARRDGNRRVYDLIERLFPADLLAERRTEEEQHRHKLRSRYQAHGLLGDRGGQQEIWIGTGPTAADRQRHRDALIADGELSPVAIEGVRGRRLMLTSEMPILDAVERSVAGGPESPGGARAGGALAGGALAGGALAGVARAGVAFLAPLDPLVWDRELLRSLFDFDYVWEVYVPAARRRWGYYVLPVLYGDRLVGRIEPRFDRSAGIVRVIDVWWQDGFDPLGGDFVDAFVEALRAHAQFGGMTRIAWPRFARHRALGRAVRTRLGAGGTVRP